MTGGNLFFNMNIKRDYSLVQAAAMIFIPAAVLMAAYIFTGLLNPPIPSILLFFLLALPILFAFQMGVLFIASKRKWNRYSLKSAFVSYEKMSKSAVFLYGVGMVVFAGAVSAVIAPLENGFFKPLCDGISQISPAYFDWNNIEFIKDYPSGTVLLTCFGYALFNVLIGPITEELFFRGYLTQKLRRFGSFTSLIVTVLFSLYHFWLPFNNIFRICAFFPAAWVAWKKKNIYISIVFHCLCNLFSTVSFIAAVYS